MAKRTVCAVAAVVRRPGPPQEFLAVQRPPADALLPNVWGLPAVTLQEGELPEAAVRRIGREKLNTTLEPVRFIGIKSMDRGDYELILMDIEARLTGPEPSVQNATAGSTRYVDQQWTQDLLLLREAAERGSVCSQVLLESCGINHR